MLGESEDRGNLGSPLASRLAVLWAIGLALAVAVNNVVYHYTPATDALVYLARGKEFAELSFFNPLTNWNYAPGYSLFLALTSPITAFKPALIAALQSLLFFAAAFVFVRRLFRARILADARLARVTLALLVCNPNLWFPLGAIGPESLVGALVLLVSVAFLRSRESQQRRHLLGASAWLGLLVLMRFEWLFLPFLGAFVVKARQRPQALAWLLVCPILAVGLNSARNQVTYGEPKLLSYASGAVIYSGNNLNLDGSYHSSEVSGFVPEAHEPERARLQALKTRDFRQWVKDQDAFFKRLAREAWVEAPLAQLAVIPLKLGKLWVMPNHFDIYTADANFTRSLQIAELFSFQRWPWYGPWKHGFYLVLHWLLLALIGAGLVGHWRGRRGLSDDARVFFSYVVAVAVLISLVFAGPLYGLPRFHVPVLMLLTFLAAQPLTNLVVRFRPARQLS